MKTALIFGASGLVGQELLRRLLDDAHYESVKVFVRRKMLIRHLHAEVHQINFDAVEEAASLIHGDDCFCALGTTMKTAGSKEAFRKVDFDLVLRIARIAKQNGIKRFLVVSSIGANTDTSNFYLKTKGEMETALQSLGFEQLVIVRPSILLGNRSEFRVGERTGILLARILSPLMLAGLRKYRPVHARTVAKAMIRLANSPPEKIIYESNELSQLAKS